jgi:hypothetical protein
MLIVDRPGAKPVSVLDCLDEILTMRGCYSNACLLMEVVVSAADWAKGRPFSERACGEAATVEPMAQMENRM